MKIEFNESLEEMREYTPEGSIVIFDAPQRRGKTLGNVMYTIDSFQHGRKIFSNIQLGIPHEPLQYYEVKLKEDGRSKYWNGHVHIDELNFFLDSRRGMKAENLEFTAQLLQIKKQGCILSGTTHNIDYLDLRFRENYDYRVVPTVYPPYPKKPKYIKLVWESGPTQPRSKKTFVYNCEPFLGLYDTGATYDPFTRPNKDDEDEDEVFPRKPRRSRRALL